MTDDVILNKCAIIERCLKRIKETYIGHEKNLATDYVVQDCIILNLQRACEAAIDLGMHLTRIKKLGLPQSSRDVFVFLEQSGLIPSLLSIDLQKMVGFRNIAIHDYQIIKVEILAAILEQKLHNFVDFVHIMRTLC
jgi:uncharacterized protein YutE (UPF0331/DUF86 family)